MVKNCSNSPTVVPEDPLEVETMQPLFGPISGGTTVTFTGRNLGGVTIAHFGQTEHNTTVWCVHLSYRGYMSSKLLCIMYSLTFRYFFNLVQQLDFLKTIILVMRTII